jgi:peptide/nickel transport system permease protein
MVFGALLFVAFAGPLFAPYAEDETVGIPYSTPTRRFPMGTDVLGRDVLTRFLYGGHTVITLAVLATFLGYAGGIVVGLAAGYDRGRLDGMLMRAVDILLAFPAIIFVLVLVAGLGVSTSILVAGVAVTHVPRVARVVRGATLEVAVRSFVEAAEARGERMLSILGREILPNLWTPILADFGVRFASSVLLVASLSFLGYGLQPPASDWALMVNENRAAITQQPYAVAIPAIALGLLTIAVSLIGDGIARAAGRSVDRRTIYT